MCRSSISPTCRPTRPKPATITRFSTRCGHGSALAVAWAPAVARSLSRRPTAASAGIMIIVTVVTTRAAAPTSSGTRPVAMAPPIST